MKPGIGSANTKNPENGEGVIWSRVREGLRFFLRRSWTIASIACLVTTALLAWRGFEPPKYAATAIVLLELDKTTHAPLDPVATADMSAALVAAQINVVKSAALISQLVDKLHLANDPEWSGARGEHPLVTSANTALRHILKPLGFSYSVSARDLAIERAKRAVSARRKGRSLILEVTAKSEDPERAAEMANVLVNLYLNKQLATIYTPDALKPGALEGPKLLSASLVAEASAAASPEPHSRLYLLTGAFIGILLGVGVGVLRDTNDQGVGGFKDAERKVGHGALASIPLVRASALKELPEGLRDASGYAVVKPMSSYAESFRNLRTALMYTENSAPPKIICLTSAKHDEGKTTAALSFARVSAMAGQKVILVNCDLRGSALNEILRVKPESGLLDVITGDAQWRDVTLKDTATNLDILPSAQDHFRPRDVFGAIAMTRLMEDLRAEYDIIILDAPPVLSVVEARVISRLADKTLMIVHWTKTPATLVKSAIHVLETTGSDVAGLVLNFVDPRAHGRLSVADTAYQAKFATRYYAS